MPEYRSVSQYKTHQQCGYRYYLERIAKAWKRPAAWLAQGTAFHYAAEQYEGSGRQLRTEDVQDVFRASYAEEINAACSETPNLDWWFPSGPYRGEADIERRFNIGLEQTARYPAWYESHPYEVIWVADDGTPGIELGFDIDLDGVRVRGYIDAVIRDTRFDGPRLIVRDNKTGNSPGDEFQLATYKVALEKTYGVEVNQGDYWMARTGKPTIPYDLTNWGEERLADAYGTLDDSVKSEDFDPDPEPAKCRFCSVSSSCEFSMG